MTEQQILIVVGLPGSGKTTFCGELKDYIILDDFIGRCHVETMINKNKSSNICFSDPRLCSIKTFLSYYKKILNCVSDDDINIILYENNPSDCGNNIKNDESDVKKGRLKTMEIYSNIYNLDLYPIKSKIKKVYSKNYSTMID